MSRAADILNHLEQVRPEIQRTLEAMRPMQALLDDQRDRLQYPRSVDRLVGWAETALAYAAAAQMVEHQQHALAEIDQSITNIRAYIAREEQRERDDHQNTEDDA